ncbi:hypothetical protein C8R46DRAFT_1232725 [Mycena filopes]|nr:hypothetical protein C8R46DRAFT_1232725 [Mycena filopes]
MSSQPTTPRERYERRIFFLLRLGDFASRAPRPAGPDRNPPRLYGVPVPPLNPDVVSIFGDQTLRAILPRSVPLSEDGWDWNYPRRVRTYGGIQPALRQSPTVARSNFPLSPPPVERDEDLWDWLFSMGRFRGGWNDFALDPPRHRFYYTPAPAGRMPIVFPSDWSIAEVAHQYFVTQVLASWYQYQIVGSLDMPILVAWNARAQSWKFQAGDFVRDLSDELCEEYGDVFKAFALAEGSLSPVHASAAIEQFLLFEQFLLWLPRVGAQVAVSQRFFDLVDELLELEDLTFIPDDREFELDRRRRELFHRERSYIVPDLVSPRSSVTILPLGWHDPRQPQKDGDTEYCAWFTFSDMQYWYDYVAEAGFNGLHARFTPAVSAFDGEPLDAEGESAHFLIGSDLQDFLLDRFLPASEFHGALVVPDNSRVPSRAPTPFLRRPRCPRRLLRRIGRNRTLFLFPRIAPRLPPSAYRLGNARTQLWSPTRRTARPLPILVALRRLRAVVLRAHRRGKAGGSCRLLVVGPLLPCVDGGPRLLVVGGGRPRLPDPDVHRHLLVVASSRSRHYSPPRRSPTPPPRRAPISLLPPRLSANLRVPPRMFAREAHRPIGAVVRQLVPGCERCGPDRFCSDDTDPCAPKSKKPRSSCYSCSKSHGSCPEWKSFHEAFNEHDDEELSGFSFEFWEHLGGGRYQLLFPDPRVADLRALARQLLTYRSFLYEVLPLQNTERSLRRMRTTNSSAGPSSAPPPVAPCEPRPQGHRGSPPPRRRSASPPRRGDYSSARPSARRSSPPRRSRGFNWGDYDLDEEPAPPPSQQASSSRVPPPRSSRPAAGSSSSSSTWTPQPPAADVSMGEDPSPLSAFFAEVEEFTPENATRDAARISSFLADQPIELRAQFLSHIASVMNIVEDELGVEMPVMDRKGKGKARE